MNGINIFRFQTFNRATILFPAIAESLLEKKTVKLKGENLAKEEATNIMYKMKAIE